VYNGVGMDIQIPAFAGMTGVFAGMTGVFAGMTGVFAGMTGVFAGMTACPKGARRTMCVQWSASGRPDSRLRGNDGCVRGNDGVS